jgi:integral membrane protein
MHVQCLGLNPLETGILANGACACHSGYFVTFQSSSRQSTMTDDKNSLHILRILAWIEASTLIALVCVAVPLKHLAGYRMPVSIMGPVHGVAFVFYMRMVISTAASGLWRRSEIWRLVVAALISFGGMMTARWITRKEGKR